ncbi:MAG: TetR/AcrR family transcriptional regulator [Propylenella sp.]
MVEEAILEEPARLALAAAAPRHRRKRNPQLTQRDILVAAREEFCEFGLDGARVDRIASRAGANKRLLYHYFGNKEALYSAVLLDAYREIRLGERELHLQELAPVEAMQRLVSFTFDHFRKNPWFIRLLATENILRAEHLKRMPEIPELHSPIVAQIRTVLAAGQREGMFRSGVDPIQLYISIAGISYFYFSNIHTLSVIFSAPLQSEEGMAARRAHVAEVILGYLRPTGGEESARK